MGFGASAVWAAWVLVLTWLKLGVPNGSYGLGPARGLRFAIPFGLLHVAVPIGDLLRRLSSLRSFEMRICYRSVHRARLKRPDTRTFDITCVEASRCSLVSMPRARGQRSNLVLISILLLANRSDRRLRVGNLNSRSMVTRADRGHPDHDAIR